MLAALRSAVRARAGTTGACLLACCAAGALAATRMRAAHHRALSQGPRVIVVGDVHGCVDELRALLGKCAFRQGTDRLIVVGDLVAKGPDSAGVIDLVRAVGGEATKGNHDHNVVTYFDGAPEFPSKEHERVAATLSPSHAEFLRALPLVIELPEHGAVVLHAGVMPGQRPRDAPPNILMNVRGVQDDGSPSFSATRGQAWAERWHGPEHIIFGHDAIRGLQRHAFATGLDTGCCYGGELTALVLPTWQLVSVRAARSYAPV